MSVQLVSVVSGMSPSVAIAQCGNQTLLEEVVVTATKRAESVKDVTVAISAYTSEQLDVLGVGESGDIASFTPNFTWNTEFCSDRSVDTIVGFVQMDFDIIEQLTINGGLSYTNELVDVDRYVGFLLVSDNLVSAYQDLDDINIDTSTEDAPKSVSFNKVTCSVSLNYLWSDDVVTYISHARGFKGGEINGGVIAVGLPFENPVLAEVHAQFEQEVTIAEPEILDAVEVCIKSTWLDGALRLNGNFFYYWYKDQQNTVLTPSLVNPKDCRPFATEMDGFAETIYKHLPDIENYVSVYNLTYDISANWKIVVDNFAEAYHIPVAHPQLERCWIRG